MVYHGPVLPGVSKIMDHISLPNASYGLKWAGAQVRAMPHDTERF
jgi:hypothetical protein